MKKSGTVSIGKVVGCHGVKGAIKLLPFTESSVYFSKGSRLLFQCEDGRESAFTVSWSKPHKRVILLGLNEIFGREESDRLRGCEVVVPRSELGEPPDDSWYWLDLIGMTVVDPNDEQLGVLDAIIQTGSNDVYVVKQKDQEILVPALASVILSVDIDNKIMRVDLPEGLT